MHIGIAGIGKMGANIGARLMEVGRKLTVWNRSADKVQPLAEAGAGVAKTPAELAGAIGPNAKGLAARSSAVANHTGLGDNGPGSLAHSCDRDTALLRRASPNFCCRRCISAALASLAALLR